MFYFFSFLFFIDLLCSVRFRVMLDFAAHEHGCNFRSGCVESGKVERVPVCRVHNRETVSSHSKHNQLCLDSRELAIPDQCILRVLVGRIGLVIRNNDERIDLEIVFDGVLNGKNTICATEIHSICCHKSLLKRHSACQPIS
jgi:hypothetical protein